MTMASPRLKPWQRGRSRNTGDMPCVHSVDWMVGRLVETRFHLTLTKTLALALALAPIGLCALEWRFTLDVESSKARVRDGDVLVGVLPF